MIDCVSFVDKTVITILLSPDAISDLSREKTVRQQLIKGLHAYLFMCRATCWSVLVGQISSICCVFNFAKRKKWREKENKGMKRQDKKHNKQAKLSVSIKQNISLIQASGKYK